MTTESKIQQAHQLQMRILRGDLMASIMSIDEVDAITSLLGQAAEEGSLQAARELATAYLNRQLPQFDPAQAVQALQRAIELGDDDSDRLRLLQTVYFHAREALPPETVRAELDALLDKGSADGEAELLRGYFHYAGFAYPADLAESVAWHRKAAARGNAKAMFELHVLSNTGQGVERDEQAAMEWLQKAAEAGSARAMYNLGAYHASGGGGFPQDYPKAVEWYRMAAGHGHGRAAATLCVMYHLGEGVEKDDEEAEEYSVIAYENGVYADDLFEELGIDYPF